MSSSSELGGWVDMDGESDWMTGDPLSPTMLRIMANNANHAADEDVQVLVNHAPFTTTAAVNKIVSDTEYGLVVQYPNLHLRLMPSGSPYPFRVRVYARTTAAALTDWVVAVTKTSDFGEVFSDVDTVRSDYDGAATAQTNSATLAWLSLTYNSGISLLTMESHANRAHSAPLRHGGTERGHSITATGILSIWAKKNTAGSLVAAVNGVYLHQYYRTT